MKTTLLTIGQALLFFVIFAAGSFLHPFNLHWLQTTMANGGTQFFVPDGLLLAVGLFLSIVTVHALRKRRCLTPWTVIAVRVEFSGG